MADWKPEPEFLEFLDQLELNYGDALPKEVWAVIMEIRAGSKLGKHFYDKAMNNREFRARYEDWKKHKDDDSKP